MFLLFQHISGYSIYLTHVTSEYIPSNKDVPRSICEGHTRKKNYVFINKTKENYYFIFMGCNEKWPNCGPG